MQTKDRSMIGDSVVGISCHRACIMSLRWGMMWHSQDTRRCGIDFESVLKFWTRETKRNNLLEKFSSKLVEVAFVGTTWVKGGKIQYYCTHVLCWWILSNPIHRWLYSNTIHIDLGILKILCLIGHRSGYKTPVYVQDPSHHQLNISLDWKLIIIIYLSSQLPLLLICSLSF